VIRIRWYHKANPVWWFGNIDDPPPAGHSRLSWYWRNFCHNGFWYVLGVADKPVVFRSTWGEATTFPPAGLGLALVNGRLPFASYRGRRVEWYAGWRPQGAFGFSFRISHAKSN
jgi:hypothetical protein